MILHFGRLLDFKASWKGDDCRLTSGDNSPDFLERVIHKNRSKGMSSLPIQNLSIVQKNISNIRPVENRN